MKYITLVRIPKNHLVRFHVDWSAGREWNDERKCMVSRELPFVPIDEIERELLNQLKPMQKELKEDDGYYVGKGYVILGPWPRESRPRSSQSLYWGPISHAPA